MAYQYTGRFQIKFQVQRRQLRCTHVDSKYAYIQIRYLKEFASKFRKNVAFICADDKALIPVGEPDQPISTGVRAHHRSLGSSLPGHFLGSSC